ncbi:MAG: zinc dependent phospholipase C family protein [Planctomycetes bacterium]|nr:zinc dependent phospholipase C family protein [Planctomycetota bacterium]
MPGITVHFQLARAGLRALEERGLTASEPAVRNAFFTGSMGPDMGYFPGGDVFATDLAHYVDTGTLARTLIESAETDLERAFAWGWLTHVLGDLAVHPLINAACGELELGDRSRPLTFADDPALHARVEVGLDALRYVQDPELADLHLRRTFDDQSIGYVTAALRSTYGVPFDGHRLLAGHRAVVRWFPVLRRVERVCGARHAGLRPRLRDRLLGCCVLAPLRVLSRALLPPRSPIHGIVTNAPPPGWLREQVEGVLADFGETLGRLWDHGLDQLPDHNLDTGEADRDDAPYAPAVRVRARLAAARSGAAGRTS